MVMTADTRENFDGFNQARRDFLRLLVVGGITGIAGGILRSDTTPKTSVTQPGLQTINTGVASNYDPYSETLANEIQLVIEKEDWSAEEAEAFQAVVPKEIDFIVSVFGPTQKYIKEVQIVKFTDQLKKDWDWPHDDEGTSCNPSSGICTVFIGKAPSTLSGTADHHREILAHGLTHAWIGGYDEKESSGKIDGQGFAFALIQKSSAISLSGSAVPQWIFGEENLANMIGSSSEEQVWQARPPHSVLNNPSSVYGQILRADSSFFKKIRNQLDIVKISEENDLGMEKIVEMTKNANPEIAKILHW